ncbi:Protein FAM69C [Aphelenchoides bicaudatus]|nr:Protein FAM69C [Aphelenchoides bicaudatus]
MRSISTRPLVSAAENQSDNEDGDNELGLVDFCCGPSSSKEHSSCSSTISSMCSALSEKAHPLAAEKSRNFNQSRTESILSNLCDLYSRKELSGNLCNLVCASPRNWTVIDFHQGANKRVLRINSNGTEFVLKTTKDYFNEFPQKLDPMIDEEELTDKIVELVNEQTKLGYPLPYKKHLIQTLWADYDLKKDGPQLSTADRNSLWTLLQQDEFITFNLLPLSRVTTKVIGSCGHFYGTEAVLPFHMKSYYMGLKAKILVHLMGTLKLFFEFLNEPLQWCDVNFSNLGLSAAKPKRFVVLDADMLYTESKLNSILEARTCKNDADCTFFDCTAKCNNSTGFCGTRANDNIDVFCQKLIGKLFGNFWSKSNRYLAACHDTSGNSSKRLADLRLVWSWSLNEI